MVIIVKSVVEGITFQKKKYWNKRLDISFYLNNIYKIIQIADFKTRKGIKIIMSVFC